MSKILEQIKTYNDIKAVEPKDYDALAEEIREFLIHSVSVTGGHLASNLGVVELTMALHICLNFPEDKLIWDVGHQAYTHKILTGRADAFDTLRTYGGISGFPKRAESVCDSFDTGHSSTSLSAALGYAKARDLRGENYTVAAVIGDGSMTGGMAYEALNNATRLGSNLIIILNDNKMSISENVGGFSKYLSNLRTKQSYVDLKDDVETILKRIPCIGDSVAESVRRSKDSLKQKLIHNGFFESLGIDYLGPLDGHDVPSLVRAINVAKRSKRPIMLHVLTQKGRGYEPAELYPSKFHGIGQFDVDTGETPEVSQHTYTDVFAMALNHMAATDDRIVAITAAMPDGTGLTKFAKRFPKRFFDVGIAEEHAVTFAAGLAAGGMKPYFAVYSSFLQRAYDQVLHDVCIQKLPVVFCVDRAGLVGADGETHQGIFDLSYMNTIPNMTIIAPKNKFELFDAMMFSRTFDAPLTIRYPRGIACEDYKAYRAPIVAGKSEWMVKGQDIVILAVGSMVDTAMKVQKAFEAEGMHLSVVNVRFTKPMDEEMLALAEVNHRLIVTMEENELIGGFGETAGAWYTAHARYKRSLLQLGIDDQYVEHGSVDVLKASLGLDVASVVKKIKEKYACLEAENEK